MEVGDLVKFKPYLKKSDLIMTIIAKKIDTGIVRYWHPKFGDGGWASQDMFYLVSKKNKKSLNISEFLHVPLIEAKNESR